jgi:hypothetical protein
MMRERCAFPYGASRQQTSVARLQGNNGGFVQCSAWDWMKFPSTSRGESHADLSAITAQPLLAINRIDNTVIRDKHII